MIKVLIIDDDMLVRKYLMQLIDWQKSGIEIVGEAIHGKHAISQIELLKPDVIIVDVSMPVMGGVDLVKYMHEHNFGVGIIMLSCRDDYEYVRESMKLGASDYILKHSLKPDELVLIIKKVYNKTRGTGSEYYSTEKKDHKVNYSLTSNDKEFLLENVCKFKRDKATRLISEYFSNFKKEGVSREQIYSFCMEVVTVINKIMKEENIAHEDVYKNVSLSQDVLSQYQNVDDVEIWLNSVFENLTRNLSKKYADNINSSEIKQTIKYISENYRNDLSLQKLADYVNLNKNYLSNLFRQETGTNFTDYILKLRIRKAKQILESSDAKIYEIAERVGFKNQYYFIRTFKKHVGVSPNVYRMNYSHKA